MYRPTLLPMPYTYQKNEAGHFVCPTCGETKVRQNTMHYHLKTHETSLPHVCPHCRKEFLHASTLALHISARHATRAATAPFKCPCCTHATLTKGNRLLHFLRKHCAGDCDRLRGPRSDDQPSTTVSCAACGKVCNSHTAFLYHIAATGCLRPTEPALATHLTSLMA